MMSRWVLLGIDQVTRTQSRMLPEPHCLSRTFRVDPVSGPPSPHRKAE